MLDIIENVKDLISSKDISKEIKGNTLNILKLILPPNAQSSIDMAQCAVEIAKSSYSIPNIIFADKVHRFFTGTFHNYEDQIRFCKRFQKGNPKYNQTIKMMLQILERIDFDEKIDWYANLTRATFLELISVELYLQLSSVLGVILPDDLKYLKTLYESKDVEETSTVAILHTYHLSTRFTPNKYGEFVKSFYNISDEGVEMLRCGLDFENYDKYKNNMNAI